MGVRPEILTTSNGPRIIALLHHKRPLALDHIVLDPKSRRLLGGQVYRLYLMLSIHLAAPCAEGRSGDRVRLAVEMQARTDRKFHSWSDRGLDRLLENGRGTASV